MSLPIRIKFWSNSFLARLLLTAIGLVVVLQAATYLAARAVIRDTVMQNARHELAVGADVFSQLLDARARQLMSSVAVLVDDFGFKEAVATGETATVQSALSNHAARIGADRAMVIDNSGRLLADSIVKGAGAAFEFPELLEEADRNGVAVANVVLDGVPYQFVVASIKAPVRIGWAGMGFQLDRNLALMLKRMTKLEISFVAEARQRNSYLATTLDPSFHSDIEQLLQSQSGVAADAVQALLVGNAVMLTSVKPLASRGYTLAAILQTPLDSVLAPYRRLSLQLLWIALSGFGAAIGAALIGGRNMGQALRGLAKAAQRIARGDYATPVKVESADEFGELARAFVQMQSAIGERERKILYQSQHDHLTGLANRSLALQMLSTTIASAAASNRCASVVVLDINRFKAVNDSFGHLVGDEVLQAIARRLQQSVKQQDTCVRLDGDEFLIVLKDADREQACLVVERIYRGLTDPIHLPDVQLTVEASFGIAAYPDDGAEPETLMRRAAIAMFSAKQKGQPLAFYQAGWDESNQRRLALLRDFKVALANDGLHVVYQPKLSLRDPQYLGAEALVRWRHPQLGPLSPDEFIPLAETSGDITLLTHWMIDRVVQQIAEWLRCGLALHVSVNISALDLLETQLTDHIAATLQRYGVAARYLCLELTESSIMRETQHSLAVLQQLRGMGIRLSVDDFGTGYSSLSQLRKLPVDEIKIDKSFVLKLAESSEDGVIVRSTIELGHNMGLEVVAEGVENEPSRELLHRFGCDMVQGYLLSKPIPADDFKQWVLAHLQNVPSGESDVANCG